MILIGMTNKEQTQEWLNDNWDWYETTIKNIMRRNDGHEDLMSYVYLELFKHEEGHSKFYNINNPNERKFWITRVILNQYKSNSSGWIKEQKPNRIFFTANNQEIQYAIMDGMEDTPTLKQPNKEWTIKAIKTSHFSWVERELFLLYLEEGSYQRLKKRTGIAHNYIVKTIKNIKYKLNNLWIEHEV